MPIIYLTITFENAVLCQLIGYCFFAQSFRNLGAFLEDKVAPAPIADDPAPQRAAHAAAAPAHAHAASAAAGANAAGRPPKAPKPLKPPPTSAASSGKDAEPKTAPAFPGRALEAAFPSLEASAVEHASSEREAGMFQPSCFIALDHDRRWVVLAIRGTMHSGDALTDSCADAVAFLTGYAHAGMCAAAWQLAKQQLPKIAQALAANPTYDLVMTGHSMGGGVAALMAMLLPSVFLPSR